MLIACYFYDVMKYVPTPPPVIPDAQQLRTVITQIIAERYVFDKNSQKNIVWK